MSPNAAQIKKWLESVVDDPQARRRVLLRGSLELRDRYIVYPAAGPWNRDPGTKGNHRWYQRKFGARYKRKDGTTGGRNTSQNLQTSWKSQLADDDYSVSTFTEVTYAPYLYDPAQRVGWAAEHGWQDVNQIAENYAPRFVELVGEEIDKQAAKPIR
jgi:hypothetical protein